MPLKMKPVAKKKPVAKNAKPVAKNAKPVAKNAKPVAKKNSAAPKTKTAPKTKAAEAASPSEARHASELLGTITCPSGSLAIFDVGLLGFLPREAMEPAIIRADVPNDRSLDVVGYRVGKGRYADCWDRVVIKLGSGEITHSTKLGEAGVDFARLLCMDYGALDAWEHEESLDGKADVVFHGRDEKYAAKSTGAKPTGEGYGWTNLSLEAADAKQLDVDKMKAAAHWALTIEFRPHSHHYYAVAEARKSKLGAGTIEVGGAQVCLFFTTWGDGVFPVFIDLDAADKPAQVRIQLATDLASE